MFQDNLTKHERVRLEAFSQAVNSSFTIVLKEGQNRPSLDDLFAHAREIETFLKASNPN